ncbi:MORN repeat-containing protein 5 [Drosophila mauritiana]|uniref:MORN repeat-containing protein 5 n=1 Tax=Drosophila mauritiana TaxID=7226 RepID=A0A6P8JSM5_DROMA|nr:MORN repeat-containing protein 5 [Drosophila mauritiana]
MEQKTTKSSSITQVDILLTGSRYIGPSDELGMQEMGVYIYPDGTHYTGEFLNNRFHGKGTIQIPDSLGVTYQVTHHNGRLVSIDQVNFNDSLPVDFVMKDHYTMSFKPWTYCTPEDRRFYQETKGPIDAVGPNKFQSKDGPNPLNLGRNIFDLGFGLLGNRGFMLDTKTFSNQSIYLGCREARRWIRENCAHGPLSKRHHKQKVLARFAREIIRNNQENAGCSQKQFMTNIHPCKHSTSLDSFASERLHLASTTDSTSSEVQAMRLRHEEFHGKWTRAKSESSVCRIN